MKHGPAVLVALVLAAAAAAGGWTAGRTLGSAPASSSAVSPGPSAALSEASPGSGAAAAPLPVSGQEHLEAARRATVRLTAPGQGYVGSGTVVSGDGLVLTNAHVAAPQAPGLADSYGRASTADDPPFLIVAPQPPGDGLVVPMFRASVVAVDGYVDLAVLRISATLDGAELPAGRRFPSIPLGGPVGPAVGERIDVLGYPVDVADGARLSITSGLVVGTSPDPTGRVQAERYSIETSARITEGYSGGAVLDVSGRLVAVPNARLDGPRARGRLRPVSLAGPLLAAATAGRPYQSPYTVKGTGDERAQPRGWGPPGGACEDLTATTLEAGMPAIAAAAQFSGMTRGEDVVFTLTRVGDDDPLGRIRSTWGPDGPDGCMSSAFAAAAAGFAGGFPAGAYQLQVRVGPELRDVGTLQLTMR